MSNLNHLFELNEKQWKQVKKWQAKHKDAPIGAIGGRYTYSFTSTSIGVVVKVRDETSGEELDVTDYDMW